VKKADVKRTDVKRTDVKKAEVQRTDLKRAEVRTDVKRAHVKRAHVKRTDVQLAYVQLAYVQLAYVQLAYVQLAYVQLAYGQLAYVLADVEGAKKKGADVLVPNYSRRPPGRGPLTLAKLLVDGHRLWFYFGCTFKFAFYGLRYVACVQNWSELDSHASNFPIHVCWNSME